MPILRPRHVAPALLALALVAPGAAFAQSGGAATADPLPSWNDTSSKAAIVSFVDRVTRPGSPEFVPVPERIATFDNDGRLWGEQPMYFQWPSSSTA